MLYNRDEVLRLREARRTDSENYFIPLGGYDTATPSKTEISNLTGTLYNHLPLVKAIVDAARTDDIPAYVGYDGRDGGTRNGTYTKNLVFLHQAADDSSLAFIYAYTHELIHLDQDRRGLLRENAPVPAARGMVDYLAHNLMLEAAAFATEAISLYYLSERSALTDVDDEVESYFDEYAAALPHNLFMRDLIEEALEGKRGKDFNGLKPAWQAVFQAFFDPDSAHVANYLKQFSSVYLQETLNENTEEKTDLRAGAWGGITELKDITTLTGWGPMFPQSALPVLLRTIRASIVQEKYLPAIDVVREHVMGIEAAEAARRDAFFGLIDEMRPK